MARATVTCDGNRAAAEVAYQLSDVIAIYPITPASPMGEQADEWSADGRTNIWGAVPRVVEMQSEAGAAGAVHGALQGGSLATTFTASQGLLLMIPNMYKIAGELTPAVIHVAARSVATHALSIFCDHSDVMAARATGWAMLASASVQEAHDLALIAHAATLETRVPFVHFFDGFRTSHELNQIEPLSPDDLRALVRPEAISGHRARGLTPDSPVLRGTAQNPDVFFQSRERSNPFYAVCPGTVADVMDRFAARTGRTYRLFDYDGHPEAEHVLVVMGSASQAVSQTVRYLSERGERVGVVTVRLYRPFSRQHLLSVLPPTTEMITVLDRTKEPGAPGEPLFLDVSSAVTEGTADGSAPFRTAPRVLGGRYGLGSKELTPSMVVGVLAESERAAPRARFTVGIEDDLSGTSVPYPEDFSIEDADTVRAVFYGLGSDGTVGANKNSIRILADSGGCYAQGYFVYDSKKAGAVTVSHLRFGPRPIRAPYLIREASFVACHQWSLLARLDVLATAEPGATVLLNSPHGPAQVWDELPREAQKRILQRDLELWVIDAAAVAREVGLGRRINTVMQTCFFALSGVLPREEAIAAIKDAVAESYGKRGQAVVEQNWAAVDAALDQLHAVSVPDRRTGHEPEPLGIPADAPPFVAEVLPQLLAGEGDRVPVSALPADGSFPVGTARYERRNLAPEIPVWDPELCIQCGKCVFVCPHAAIRQKVVDPAALADAPETLQSTDARWRELAGQRYLLQVAPEDCTGCQLCVAACPAHDRADAPRYAIEMAPQAPLRETERENWAFFRQLPEVDRTAISPTTVRNSQLLEPLFEFSGACVGCGETPYLRLLSQLFGDRLLVANATGCSSIFGGNLPTTPWAANADGRGPAWSNSLFEDNAEFGLGMKLAVDSRRTQAVELLRVLTDGGTLDEASVAALLSADQSSEAGIRDQRARVSQLRAVLANIDDPRATQLAELADALVRKTVWIVGGDGWAYDIGSAGVDHVLASGQDVNLLVLDTEVYSNTGGQASKATPRAAVARFAAQGKAQAKKDLGLMAMAYGDVYVARVAMGARDQQTLRALLEAEAYDGPSLVIAYAHCIAHGIDMSTGLEQQERAVASGHWPLYRYDPSRVADGESPLTIDSREPSISMQEYAYHERRYRSLADRDPERAAALMNQAQRDANGRWALYRQLAEMHYARAQNNDRGTNNGHAERNAAEGTTNGSASTAE